MPLSGSESIWGPARLAAVSASIPQDRELTPSELSDIWVALSGVDASHIVSTTLVAVTSVTAVTPGVGVSGPGTGLLT